MSKIFYVIYVKNQGYFSYDKGSGGYPFFGSDFETAERFYDYDKVLDYLKNSKYTQELFVDKFKNGVVHKVTMTVEEYEN